MKLFNTWKKADYLFVKPKLKFHISTYRKAPSMYPVNRNEYIYVFRNHWMYHEEKHIFTKEFQNKLNKWYLGWLKPKYKLPDWLVFKYEDYDVFYKTKWSSSDFRFEHSPYWRLTLFGISFCLVAVPPGDIGDYWESVLQYNYNVTKKPYGLMELIRDMGHWTSKDSKDVVVQKCFLKEEHHDYYDSCVKTYWNEVSK